MRNLLFYYLFLCSVVHADPERQDIAQIKKQKEALSLERQKCLKEADTLEKMINALSVASEKKKEKLVEHGEDISKTLPLLARLERSNPLRMLVDPTTGQYKVRGVILMRLLISSTKRKIQQVKQEINKITIMANDLEFKSRSNAQQLQDLERQKTQLSLLENKQIEKWTKTEQERLAKEEDVNTLLEEARSTLSKTIRAARAATALKGLPFSKLEQPVRGKLFKDATLQSKFSPHSQGVFFETQKNAYVCAPAKGNVVFKGPFRAHAEILIIDHGEKVHTILMGMHKINANVGENVYAGEKLGIMAGYGSGHPTLYLELRHKGKSIDPTPYFVIKNLE